MMGMLDGGDASCSVEPMVNELGVKVLVMVVAAVSVSTSDVEVVVWMQRLSR